jgi:hypothetical protein
MPDERVIQAYCTLVGKQSVATHKVREVHVSRQSEKLNQVSFLLRWVSWWEPICNHLLHAERWTTTRACEPAPITQVKFVWKW